LSEHAPRAKMIVNSRNVLFMFLCFFQLVANGLVYE
jgi:hypothetical protein